MRIADTYTQQNNKGTWWHNGRQTWHELDHVLVKWWDMWHACKVSVIHPERAINLGVAPWQMYTDHKPLEIVLRFGKDWTRQKASKPELANRINVKALRGPSAAAKEKRLQYEE